MAVATIETDTTTRAAIRFHVGPLYAAVLAALAFLRVASTNAIHVMFVDDAIFLERVRWFGPWDTITYPRSGYSNIAPMTVAQAFEWVPDAAIPITYITAWSIVVGLLGWFVADASRAFLSSELARMTAGAAVVLVPVAAVESVGTLSNFQWYLMAAATYALACRVRSWAAVGVVVAATLSAPAALMLAPLVAWHRHRAMIIGWCTGAAVQVFVILRHWGERDTTDGVWFEIVNIPRTFLVASLNGATTYENGSRNPGVLAVIAVVMIVVVAARRDNTAIVGVLAVGAALQWWFTYTGGAPYGTDPRYVVAPAIIATGCIVWAAEQRDGRVLWATVGVLAVTWVMSFQATPFRALTATDWERQLTEQPCVDGARSLAPAPDHLASSVTVDLPC